MLKNKENKILDYCGACSFYLGAIIITLICQALVSVVSALLSQRTDIASNGDFLTACMIFIQAANALFIFLFCKVNKYGLDCALVCKPQTKKVDFRDFIIPIALALAVLFAMYLPTIWYGYFTTYALHISPSAGNIDLDTAASVVMIVIASVFMAPVFEETIYRGVLFNGLKQKRSTVKAVLLSALAFMLMHMSPIQVVFQFALGAVAAAVMHKTGRLLPCVLLHASANAVALAIQFEPFAGGISGCLAWLTANPATAVFITLGCALVGGGAAYALIRFGYGRDQIVEPVAQDDGQTPDGADKKQVVLGEACKKDGSVRFWIAMAISGVLFIINLITMVAGQ